MEGPGLGLCRGDVAVLVFDSEEGVTTTIFLHSVGILMLATVDLDAVEFAHGACCHGEFHIAIFCSVEVIAATIVGVVVAFGYVPL